jgi:leucyl aminopeptidase
VSTDNGRQKRTPFSLKVPQASLDHAIPVAAALHDYGAPATPHVIAQKMKTTYSSSWFKTRIAAAGYYGLIRVEGDKRVLTGRGEAICADDEDAALQARREAVMGTSFGPLIHSLRSGKVNESNIALRLQHESGVPEGSAPAVAKALIEAATQAQLASAEYFDAAAIESAAHALPKNASAPAPGPTQSQSPKEQQKQRPESQKKDEQTAEDTGAANSDTTRTDQSSVVRPLAPTVRVVININAESLTPQEIADLVRAIQSNEQPPQNT